MVLLVAALLPLKLIQAQTPILDDGFTDGGRSNGTDALDANWYSIGVAGTGLTVVDDSAGIGSGNALKLTPTATFQGMVANLPSSVTLSDGDTVTLYFDWRFTGTTNLNQGARLRFGLYNSGGTLTAGDNVTTVRTNDTGYCGYTNPGLASSNSTSACREPSGDEITMGSNLVAIGTAGASINGGTIAHNAMISISRSGSTLNLTVSIGGQTAATATDTTPLTYTFDEIAFSNGGGSTPSPLILDNVQVDYSPQAVNDGFTDGGRTDGTDARDIAWYSLGSPSLSVVDDSSGIGSGNALKMTSSATFQGMVGNAPWFHLGDGDSLTLLIDWRFSGTTGLNESNKLRFGLHNSEDTPASTDNAGSVFNDDVGYVMESNPGLSSGTGTTLFRELSGDAILGGTNLTAIGSTGTSVNSGTTKHTTTLTLRRSGTSLVYSANIDGLAAASATDATPPTYIFDEIGTLLAGSTVPSPYLIDNIRYNYNTATPSPQPEGPPPGSWSMTFDDEFTGTSLNTAVWSKGMLWDAVINNEWEGYVPENVTVANGLCTIKVEKRTVQNTDMYGNKGQTMNYASGCLQTFGKFTQAYGYFEARIRTATGPGTWPAFWMDPDRGSASGSARTVVGDPIVNGTDWGEGTEIDILESMATWKDPTSHLSRSHSGFFWDYLAGDNWGIYGHKNGVVGRNYLLNPDTQFHNYGVYWSPSQLVYYVDGRVVSRRDNDSKIGVVPNYLILNCALTNNDWTGNTVPTANIDAGLPCTMDIDYVRVYSGTPSSPP